MRALLVDWTRHRQWSAVVTARTMAARREQPTAWAAGAQLQSPRSTVVAILRWRRFTGLAQLTPPLPATRYGWRGDLVELDVKTAHAPRGPKHLLWPMVLGRRGDTLPMPFIDAAAEVLVPE